MFSRQFENLIEEGKNLDFDTKGHFKAGFVNLRQS